MSRMFNRIAETIEGKLKPSELVTLWNKFAEDNSYEFIYSMGEFDEIVGGNRPYNDFKKDLSLDWDDNKDYFYLNQGTGIYYSTDDPFDVVDVDMLADRIKEDEGLPRDVVIEKIDEIFNGFGFEREMDKVVNSLSAEEVNDVIKAFQSLDFDDSFKDMGEEDIVDKLEECADDGNHAAVWQLPEAIQSKYFEFVDPDFSYIHSNIGVKGPVPAEKSLELAGFEYLKDNFYVFNSGRSDYHRYEIKLKDGIIKSAKPYEQDKSLSR